MSKERIRKKRIIWILICVLCFAICLVFYFVRSSIAAKQVSQQMAERWSDEKGFTQISCYFTRAAEMTRQRLIGLEHDIDDQLQEASIVVENGSESARLWTDAYSAQGTLMVSTDRGSLNLKAMGVGGDFFQFHPMDLEYGNYFSDSDLNHDYVVIDEEIAWQLFGGIDVTGKIVYVSGEPHVISGVIKRPQGKMDVAAGLSESVIYVSMDTLEKYGNPDPINHYEIVMPNPIKGFAMSILQDKIGVVDSEVELVENTNRYSLLSSLKLLEKFGYRSMNGKAIIYPYWENLARGYEDILALLAVFVLLFFAIPALAILCQLYYRWRHKKWTVGSLLKKLMDFLGDLRYRIGTGIRAKLASKKRKPISITFEEEDENEKE